MSEPESPHEQVIETFAATLDAAGGRAITATSLRDIVAVIIDTPGIDPDARIWMAPQATQAFPALEAALREAGLTPGSPDDAATVRDAPLGITAARLAIAETGSVLLQENDLPGRAVSLVTQRLIVLCPLPALVPSLDDAAPVLRDLASAGPSYATFVTGPSRTADIERELAVGVQGPGEMVVVFVPDAVSG